MSEMFDKILIANRGEIACRIIRTARALGVQTVAVYSDADQDALHVTQADQAVRLGAAPVADSYLRGDLIIQAALGTGAQAIHPGYGFLSENPDFVDAVVAAGLVFIGPSADAIRAMGLKDAAKALMQKAGVPVVPGYHGSDQSAQTLADEASQIGYPVLIKAVAGGGGKGMRLVEDPSDFTEALASAQSEAKTAFGNADVLVEKYVTHPRHIEVQVFGDGTDAVHLFERDCSLQRRHQKVIEEAPAPGMTDAVRKTMGDAAVKAAKAIGYAGAGTIEFIVDGSDGLRPDRFWFMEMNTRLQVEHPVTEAITGVDLVAWQLHVAAGGTLPLTQDQLSINGHSFEARIYAEDVPAGFLPATGQLTHLTFPTDARIDSGVVAGSEISPWYDPMIAKLTVHGPTRQIALKRLQTALGNTQAAGTTTNLNFLRKLAAQTDFAAGNVDTGLIARHHGALCTDNAADPLDIAVAAITAMGLVAPMNTHAGFALWAPLAQTVTLQRGEDQFGIAVTITGQSTVDVSIDDTILTLTAQGTRWAASGQRRHAVLHGDQISVFGPQTITFTRPNPLDRGGVTVGGDTVAAPMPGLIHDVAVTTGDLVTQGQLLVVLEAMKMEHILRAPRDGTVQSVSAVTGGQVSAGDVLVALEPDT
ncbi:MAG: 3-methylcrotonyl-CoA carboxylase alpha subunit [Gammaproteobacteria bacterium]|jgi:3-methylcrotonyl-CoA carboxylase alpha subunit